MTKRRSGAKIIKMRRILIAMAGWAQLLDVEKANRNLRLILAGSKTDVFELYSIIFFSR